MSDSVCDCVRRMRAHCPVVALVQSRPEAGSTFPLYCLARRITIRWTIRFMQVTGKRVACCGWTRWCEEASLLCQDCDPTSVLQIRGVYKHWPKMVEAFCSGMAFGFVSTTIPVRNCSRFICLGRRSVVLCVMLPPATCVDVPCCVSECLCSIMVKQGKSNCACSSAARKPRFVGPDSLFGTLPEPRVWPSAGTTLSSPIVASAQSTPEAVH